MPGQSSTTAVAITWAASWRISHSASSPPRPSLRAVTIAISAPSGSSAERSRSSPSTSIPSASRASRGPIAAAASAPVAPAASSSGEPSGRVTVSFAIAPACYAAAPSHTNVPQSRAWRRLRDVRRSAGLGSVLAQGRAVELAVARSAAARRGRRCASGPCSPRAARRTAGAARRDRARRRCGALRAPITASPSSLSGIPTTAASRTPGDGVQQLLDLPRDDLLPARLDDVVAAADEVQVARPRRAGRGRRSPARAPTASAPGAASPPSPRGCSSSPASRAPRGRSARRPAPGAGDVAVRRPRSRPRCRGSGSRPRSGAARAGRAAGSRPAGLGLSVHRVEARVREGRAQRLRSSARAVGGAGVGQRPQARGTRARSSPRSESRTPNTVGTPGSAGDPLVARAARRPAPANANPGSSTRVPPLRTQVSSW